MGRSFVPPLALLVTLCVAATTPAADILVLGDSWGVGINQAITSVAGNAGFTVNNQAHGGREAADMVTPDGLSEITSDLNANPDASVVHLIIGGNDFLRNWNRFLSPSQELNLFNSILNDIETISDHIATIRPEVEVFHMGYEFPQPIPNGPVVEVNQAILTLSGLQGTIASPNYNYIEFYGLTQEVFGIGGNPPDGTSDPNFPGAPAAFSDNIHLNQAGYLIYAEAAFDRYRAALVPEPSAGALLVAWSLALPLTRRRRI